MKKTINSRKVMEFTASNGDLCVRVENMHNFLPSDIFECGQCFRFDAIGKEYYGGVAKGKYIKVRKDGADIVFENVNLSDFENIWSDYFDLERDYGQIIKDLSRDEVLKKAASLCSGIRILKQESFEAVISFIISQNNNIPRIKKIIGRLCSEFGEKIIYRGTEFFAFPTFESLANADEKSLDFLKAGFRTKYILDFIAKIKYNEIDLSVVEKMPLEDASAYLQRVKGIGPKVSACILLYGCHRLDAFPIDVWIKKVMEKYYANSEKPPKELFGDYAGVAQQYLFYYERSLLQKSSETNT